jgi:hypothetical protein
MAADCGMARALLVNGWPMDWRGWPGGGKTTGPGLTGGRSGLRMPRWDAPQAEEADVLVAHR